MKPIFSYDDFEITKVECTKTKWVKEKNKHIQLKKPQIKKGETIKCSVYDLVDLIETLRFHSDEHCNYYSDDNYLEVKFKLTTNYWNQFIFRQSDILGLP